MILGKAKLLCQNFCSLKLKLIKMQSEKSCFNQLLSCLEISIIIRIVNSPWDQYKQRVQSVQCKGNDDMACIFE